MPNTWKREFEYKDIYEYRIDNMISLINLMELNSIMDLGCGKQTLRRKLPEHIKYIGVDQYDHVDSTIVIDFNKGEFYNEKVDVIFCSGIIEYIYDIEQFIKNISKNTNIILGSYNFLEDGYRDEKFVNQYAQEPDILH